MDIANLPQEAIGHLNKLVVITSAAKGSMLIRKGQRCDHFYIIQKGFARIYAVIDDRQITTLFARENDIITSTYALFTKGNSDENVEILEDSMLLKIDYEAFIDSCNANPHLLKLYRVMMEKHYLALEERTLSLQFDSALERYQKLLSRHPFILQRASLGSIASYLGMSHVTLSRMRAQV
ncbi:Crp/Fnr family transcriptional regulator [Parapedobacter deserti]|uniref:Crp/Fnr family transcriptional regulator n=1 Tax=Parapedobacter deserti TaxID=1912957 RepID=A0ABV7JT65_9SPHI